MRYPRDMQGYGKKPPFANWPEDSVIAVQFVLNYEEGGENCVLHGDDASEAFLSEISGAAPWPGQRHWNMESIYEYGARAGFWRLHRIFTYRDVPVTVYGVATALERSPEQVRAMLDADWEIASHGLKWIDYKDYTPEAERADMMEAIRIHTEVTGSRPRGWYTGRCSINTLALACEEGGFDYLSDSYADDLPYWHWHKGKPQLIIPYTLDVNDMRFATASGFSSGGQFYTYLKDTFDVLYAEGLAGTPRMMNIGLHCRLAGRPGRAAAIARFIDYIQSHYNVLLARRIDIARHWTQHHPAPGRILIPSEMPGDEFVRQFGGVFEHSPWIAERAYSLELGPAHNTAVGLHSAFCRIFRRASDEERMGVIKAHPDLAGRLAGAKQLTAESTSEQASAGLDALTAKERVLFTELNTEYTKRYGFPFILAVKGRNKDQILQHFRARLHNDKETEFANACHEVERIALLRLEDMLP